MTTKAENDIAEPRYKLAQSEGLSTWENHADKKIPVDLNEIIEAMGVRLIEFHPPAGFHSDGATSIDATGFCTIMYRKDVSEERQRFTLAHELGHIILEHISFDGSTSQYSGGSQEKEANAFAGALLVPSKDIKAFMKNGDKNLEDIIRRYQVSKEVASIAINANKLLNKVRID